MIPLGGKSSRIKGSSAEREVADIIKAKLGIEIVRTPHSGAGHIKGDIMSKPYSERSKLSDEFDRFIPEIKRQERLRVVEWFEQAQEQCSKNGKIPILMFRQNRKKWMIQMTLDDWLDIISRLAD